MIKTTAARPAKSVRISSMDAIIFPLAKCSPIFKGGE
jgi:hypothetical protein